MLSGNETRHAHAPFDGGHYRIAIVGGGFSGASMARSLARSGLFRPGEIVVYEPRQTLGAGMAYDTQVPGLRLNVPAHRMRALPERPDAFLRFLEETGRLDRDPEAVAGGDIYANRSDFAAFMQTVLEPLLASGAIIHHRDRLAGLSPAGNGWHLRTAAGARHSADAVVIAIGHPAAEAPGPLAELTGHDERILTDPAKVQTVRSGDRILIVGCGLTALDFLTALERQGHRGMLTLLSRNGLLPAPQSREHTEPFGDFLCPPAHTTRTLLVAVRQAIREAKAAGLPWHSVFDTLRRQGQDIWRALPESEKDRFLRHLRRRYEISRFRMPPQNEALLQNHIRDGRLDLLAGHVERASGDRDGLHVTFRCKPVAAGQQRVFDRIVLATGPDQRRHFRTQGWLAGLQSAGHVMPAPHGLGIACDTDSRVVGSDGVARDTLYVIGPPTRGTFGEITGAPEIAAQAERIAAQLQGLAERPRQNRSFSSF